MLPRPGGRPSPSVSPLIRFVFFLERFGSASFRLFLSAALGMASDHLAPVNVFEHIGNHWCGSGTAANFATDAALVANRKRLLGMDRDVVRADRHGCDVTVKNFGAMRCLHVFVIRDTAFRFAA